MDEEERSSRSFSEDLERLREVTKGRQLSIKWGGIGGVWRRSSRVNSLKSSLSFSQVSRQSWEGGAILVELEVKLTSEVIAVEFLGGSHSSKREEFVSARIVVPVEIAELSECC